MNESNAAMMAAGAKARMINDCVDTTELVEAMAKAVEDNFPAAEGVETCDGLSRKDVMRLVTTALQWSYTSAAGNEYDRPFKNVELGRVTTSTMLPGLAGWCYQWWIK